jgi:hypothetical protein
MLESHFPIHRDRNKGQTGEEQSKEHAYYFSFTSRGLFKKKKFVLAGQTVNSAYNSELYVDCMKMYQDFTSKFGENRTGCCITTMYHFHLHQGIFYQTQQDFLSPPNLLPSVSPIEDKTEGRHFCTIEVTEAESQVMLDIRTEHDFQD